MAYVDYYYHVDATHGSFNAMKSDAAAEHASGAPGAELSVFMNQAETEALIKVRTENGSYSPDWDNAPFVIRKYTKADHLDAVALIQTLAWITPERRRDAGGFCIDENDVRVDSSTGEALCFDADDRWIDCDTKLPMPGH